MDHTIFVKAGAGRRDGTSEPAAPERHVTPPAVTGSLTDARYVLPLKWADDDGLAELAHYLAEVSSWLPVTVVDGSAEELFAAHRRALPESVEHVRPEPWPGANGKVAGVMTGVRRAREERIVVADDDVRHTRRTLEQMVALLGRAEVVRPQNYYLDLPWQARWDSGRALLNRALGGDWPGTLGVRRSILLAAGGYDGDVLFENLELVRTVRAAGGREAVALDVLVGRVPPTVSHFVGQRVRQAYDDFAQPPRLLAELSLLPLMCWAVRRPGRLVAGAVAVCGVAEIGRRRAGGTQVFPAGTVLWAPLWVLERSMCVWAAVAVRARGGVSYAGARLRTAGHSRTALRRRLRCGDRGPLLLRGTGPERARSQR
ncbi:glycosyltransferase family 2 protein [Kocuria aegyptia]|uniref:Glycosyltransferase 2-like domain-containing protein n=1 Tax=Kocuria aegyptia TaxID=330943 RepID=A0ABN2KDG0_9MICC